MDINKNDSKNNQTQRKNSTSSDSKKQFFIDTIAKYCDKCGSPYSTNDLQIIQESKFSTIIHFSCRKCKSTHIATFIRPVGVSSRMAVNTDLSVKEISKFAKKNVISADDILDVYSELEKSEGKLEV